MTIPPRRRIRRWPSRGSAILFIADVVIALGLIALLLWSFS